MPLFSEGPDRGGIAASLSKMADGFSKLVSQHIALLKLELEQDARAVGGELGRMAAFVPFVLTGYLLLCGAVAVVLSRWIGMAGGLAVMGAANAIGGAVGITRALARLRARQFNLGGSIEEFTRSAQALASNGTTNDIRAPEIPHGR